MALTIGTDSYATLAEATTYIESHYTSTNTQRVAWEALSDADQEALLRQACEAMGNIKYQGRKKEIDQVLAFPRCYKNAYYYPLNWYETVSYLDCLWYCETDVTDIVKNAQIAEAVELGSASSDTKDYDVMTGNTQSFSITGLSKTYKSLPTSASGTPETELRSKKAQKLLMQYVGGGFSVR